MDLNVNFVLLWTAGLMAIAHTLQSWRLRRYVDSSWKTAGLLTLGLIGLSLVVAPNQAGMISMAFVLLLVIVPIHLHRRAIVMIARGDYEKALRLTKVVALLHPGRFARQSLDSAQALVTAKYGDFEMGRRILAGMDSGELAPDLMQRFNFLRILQQWPAIVALTEGLKPESIAGQAEFTGILQRVRALGEMGKLPEALDLYLHLKRSAPPPMREAFHAIGVDVVLLALAGRVGAADRLGTILKSPRMEEFWSATAELMSGRPEARQRLERIARNSDDAIFVEAIRYRLDQSATVSPMQTLDPTTVAALDEIERDTDLYMKYGLRAPQCKRPVLTQTLAALILAVFLLEVLLGDPNETVTLYQMGALDIQRGLWTQSWRLMAHLFLHLGWLHLIMNRLGLIVFGAFLERRLRPLQFLLLYFGAGVGSAVTYLLISR